MSSATYSIENLNACWFEFYVVYTMVRILSNDYTIDVVMLVPNVGSKSELLVCSS